MAIICILAALLLSALSQTQRRADRIHCLSDLKEVGVAFQMFAHDHAGRFPTQVPVSEGGSQEFLQASYLVKGDFYFSYRHFLTLSNELVAPKLLVCPADTREAATSFSTLNNSNLSYFVAAYARLGEANSVLAGDRNLSNNLHTPQSRLWIGPGNSLWWTRELHRFKGNVLFGDGHVEQMNNPGLNVTNGLAAVVVLLPTIQSVGPGGRGSGLTAGATAPGVVTPAPSLKSTPKPVDAALAKPATTAPRPPLILAPGAGKGSGASAPAPATTQTVVPPATGSETVVTATAQTNSVVPAVPVQKGEPEWWLWLLLLIFLLLLWLWFRRQKTAGHGRHEN